MTYYEKLKMLREKKSKTQHEIAQILQTSQQYYGKYENGKRPMPLDHLVTLCRYYNVSADWLLGLKEE